MEPISKSITKETRKLKEIEKLALQLKIDMSLFFMRYNGPWARSV